MRRKAVALWFIGSAFLVIALQFWLLVVVSRWIIHDSYALQAFPAAHPALGFFIDLLSIVGDFGGVALLVLALSTLFWWFTTHAKTASARGQPLN